MPAGTFGLLLRSLMAALPLFAAWLVFRGLYLLLRRKHAPLRWPREAVLWVLVFYLLTLVQITAIRGWNGGLQLSELPVRLARVNYIPLVGLLRLIRHGSMGEAAYNILGNLLWFFPAGLLPPVVWRRLRRFLPMVAAGAALSLCIELSQLLLGTGITDVDDILLNAAGTAAGYGLYRLGQRIWTRKRQVRTHAESGAHGIH